jgi:hypothetical protein
VQVYLPPRKAIGKSSKYKGGEDGVGSSDEEDVVSGLYKQRAYFEIIDKLAMED